MHKRNLILGLDPGTTDTGWALYDHTCQQMLLVGHSPWIEIRRLIKQNGNRIKAVCVEQMLLYSGVPPSKHVMETAHDIGRIQQICEDNDIVYHHLPRIDICARIYGSRPKPGNKISKKDMQIAVQKHLHADEFIRPQHCNDAASVILAEYPIYD